MRIPRSSTYAQFLKKIYQKIGVDSNEYLLKVSAKHSCQYLGRLKETLFSITNDDSLSFLLDPEAEIPMLEVYVDAKQIHVEPPPPMSQQWGEINPQMSQQWGEYMNLLATPGLPPCSNTDYLAGTSNPDFGAGTSNLDFGAGTSHSEPEYYTPNLVTVTEGLDNIDFHYTEPTQSHTPLSENFIPNENDGEDPTTDSFVNESDEASEPDEIEYPIPPEDGPDRVDINVMAETFAERGAETSSEPALPDLNTQPTFYRSIPFFQQTFPEIPADSVDVPNLRYAKFYNKSEGRLDKGMLFKTKEKLMEAVQDHFIRHARREYYVTESSKTKWKVLCKHSTEEQWCRWELRGAYKPKIRRWKITVYKGTHTCVLNNMSLAHGNINRAYIASLHLGHVKCNPSYGIKHIIQNVKDQRGYDVPYQKTWYSLKMAREIVYGTWESSVPKLPAYLGAIQKYNPGTIVEWKHKGFQASTGKYVMGYVFWAFKPCIDGFQFCRNVISVDGTHLYTKYKYKLLIAAVMDGNQQFVKVRTLCHHMECTGIAYAMCVLILTVLLKCGIEGSLWQAGSEYQLRKFNRIMDEIKKQDVKAFAYLDAINKEKWTASHDGGWRCGILTTNMSECINGVLKGARRLPMFISWQQKAVEHTITKYSHAQQSASVVTRRQGRHGMNTHVVKIANRECSCGKWNQFGIPCSHAQKVCGAYNISVASMVKDYYDVMAYNNTYSKHFEPVQSEDYWDDPNFQLVHDPTIRTVTHPGRNQTTRIHNEMDWRQTRARQEAQQQQGDSSIQENMP
ncbi:UNVERIFIED_CONTAM: hypothetical protein Sangu_0025700 [Sesamum angustifolium]|uniref:SWIM-type domain-containing protein n=1 Tax=Sesamum angustifolium TaxID=2727405 RepID=A0AAW2RHU7_9LAMI